MGAYLSRTNSGVEEIGISPDISYTFPPKSGSYFGNHFFMGGKKFDTMQPEGYLFGDNSDLNYLGPYPHNFTYQSPSNQPVRALKCLINIRKDSLRLIRVPNPPGKPEGLITNSDETENQPAPSLLYNLEFTFDADSPCTITVYYNCAEEMANKSVLFTTNSEEERSDTVHYNAGCNQQFCLPSHVIDPASLYKKEPKPWDPSNIPIAIQVCAQCGPNFSGHSHITYAVLDKNSDESWNIKVTKQKQAINGVCYLFQEIYGIENKNKSTRDVDGDAGVPDAGFDDEDNSECVVCLSDSRDTLILPCKHLCLCSTCANQLRFQQSGCPICRQPFRALLQIRAVRKSSGLSPPHIQQSTSEENADRQSVNTTATDETTARDTPLPQDVSVPSGYEVIPLIDAINGPVTSVSLASLDIGDGTLAPSTISSVSSASSFRHSGRKKKNKVDIENEVMSSVDESGNEGKKSRGRRKKKLIGSVDQTSAVNQQDASTDDVAKPDEEQPTATTDEWVDEDLQSTTTDEVSPRPVTPPTETSPETSPEHEALHEETTACTDEPKEENVLVHPLESAEEPPESRHSELA